MSESLLFLKIDTSKIFLELLNILEKNGGYSYQNFLFDNKDDGISFKTVIKQLNSHKFTLNQDEIWSIIDWLYTQFEKQSGNNHLDLSQQVYQNLASYGLEKIHDIDADALVKKFNDLLKEYGELIRLELNTVFNKEEMVQFLDFLIVYSGEIALFLNQYYYALGEEHPSTLEIRELVQISLQSSSINLQAMVQPKLDQLYNSNAIDLISQSREFRRNDETSDAISNQLEAALTMEAQLINTSNLLPTTVELKEKLSDYSGSLIRLHSY